jgi:hypothetical protein
MKNLSRSKMAGEIVYSYHKDPGNIAIGKTKNGFEKREIAEALAHIYGYG